MRIHYWPAAVAVTDARGTVPGAGVLIRFRDKSSERPTVVRGEIIPAEGTAPECWAGSVYHALARVWDTDISRALDAVARVAACGHNGVAEL